MKRILSLGIVIILLFIMTACSSSINEKVKIDNVNLVSFRPEGYNGPTGVDGGFNWDGVIITGDITNISNETLRDIVVVVHSHGANNKNSRKNETNRITLEPGETKQFQYKFVYDDQNVPGPFAWYHDIDGVIQK